MVRFISAGLSKTSAGILTGAYAAGNLVAAIPAGWLAGRWGGLTKTECGIHMFGKDEGPKEIEAEE